MFAFKFEVRTKKVSLWKQNRSTDKVISINQSFKVLHTGTNTCPQPWPPLTNGLVDDALLELSPDRNWPLLILQGSVATLFRWSWKILSYFVANLSETLHINFYQNWSSIVEVMMKKFWCVFLCLTVYMQCNQGQVFRMTAVAVFRLFNALMLLVWWQ